jgi:hypothetical protein
MGRHSANAVLILDQGVNFVRNSIFGEIFSVADVFFYHLQRTIDRVASV